MGNDPNALQKAKAAKLTTANRSVGDDEYKLSVRRASVEEATLFGQAAASASRPTIWCWPIWSNWMVSRQACRHNGLRCFRGKSAATWRTISMISSATTSRLLASATLNK
jgi:hypothetical protein